jgi:multidrug efflux pump subunit AcrA (membrane-fusion protein)
MRAVLRYLPGLLAVVLVGWVGYKYIWPLFQPTAPEMDVQTATVQRGDLRQVVPADGVVVPSVQVEVKSKAAGVVEKIEVEVGDEVTPGQTLLELDKEQIESQLSQAEADLTAAEAQYALTKRNLSPQQKASAESSIRNAQIAVDGAKDALDKQQAAYERIRTLADKGYASQSELDDAQSALNAAQKAYDTAVEQLSSAKEQYRLDLQGGQKEQIAAAAATVKRQQAEVDSMRDELGYTTVKAPIAGTVLGRPVEVGTAVSSGTQGSTGGTVVATIGDLNTLYVKASVDETDLGRIKTGGKCRVSFDAYQGWLWDGSVKKIYPQGQNSQGSAEINPFSASGGTKFQMDVAIDLKSGRRDNSGVSGMSHGLQGVGGGRGGGGGRRGGGGGGRRAGGGPAGGAGRASGAGPGTAPGTGTPGEGGEHHRREPETPPKLLPNMTASVEVVLEDHPDVVILPAQYVKYDPAGKAYTEVINKAAWEKFQTDQKNAPEAAKPAGPNAKPQHPEQKLPRERRELELGFSDGLRQEVKDGLQEGDVVILERPIKKTQ